MAKPVRQMTASVRRTSLRRFFRAVASRDARQDGVFVYAVRSTGIYCRPSCPSRRPNPKHLLFFVVPEEAERAGYSPCGRCHPKQVAISPQMETVRRVCLAIQAEPEAPATLRRLAQAAGLSPQHLQRTFRRVMGITPRQYADHLRIGRLKSQLRRQNDVTNPLSKAAHGSPTPPYHPSMPLLGMTP